MRKAKLKDYRKINELGCQLNDLHVEQRPDIFFRCSKFIKKHVFNKIVFDNDKICLVYEKDNEIIGFCIAQISFTGENKTKTLFIDYIFVSQSYRRNKIGTLLMNKLQEIAKQHKCNKIQLSVFCFNQNAIEFYKKIGMSEQKIVMEQFIKDLK